MKKLNDYAKVESDNKLIAKRKSDKVHPKGWEPKFEHDGERGEIVSYPQESEKINDWSAILEELNLDPSKFDVVEPVQVRSWDSAIDGGKRMYYYRAAIVSKELKVNDLDYKKLVSDIRKFKKSQKPKTTTNQDSLVVCLSDWQMGKPDGDGTDGIVERASRMIPQVIEHAKNVNKLGAKIKNLYVLSLGDMIENCDGHYASQTYGVQLNKRDQSKVVRRLVTEALIEWAPHFENVVVAAVPGNHGENRNNGKSYTDLNDNEDVAIFERIADAFKLNKKAFGHIKFVLPDNDLCLTLDISGHSVGLVHGHQFRTGGRYSFQKALSWLSGQAMGKSDIGDVDLLISGHFHHYFCQPRGGRWFMQCPSLDGGSGWYTDTTGDHSGPGTLVFLISAEKKEYFWEYPKIIE